MKLYLNLDTNEVITEGVYNVRTLDDYARMSGILIDESLTLKEFREKDKIYEEYDLLDFDFINGFGNTDVFGLATDSNDEIVVLTKDISNSKYKLYFLNEEDYINLLDLSNQWNSTDDGFIRDDLEQQLSYLLGR